MTIVRYSVALSMLLLVAGGPGVTFPASAQSLASNDRDWDLPRTPWGHPDLQGNWTNVTLTPFERDDDHQGLVLSPEEARRIENGEAARVEARRQPSDPDRDAPDAGGSVGGYNNVYIDRGDRIAIVNGEHRSSLVTFPEDGQRPPLTPEGEARLRDLRESNDRFEAYDHPELRPLGERCLMSFGSSAGPPMIPNNFYNNNYTIVQNADHVMIHTEMVHDTRIIRLGEGPRLPPQVTPWMGDSWGRWDGDTLVVETTNIYPLQRFRGIPPTDDLRVTERFTRVDEETILYEFTVDDPSTYSEPWGGQIPFNRLDDQLYEYACHEGNYALHNILSGARYQERQDARGEAREPR